jgi:hypothetical protein
VKAPWFFLICVGFIGALELLPGAQAAPSSDGMKTITKTKKATRKPAARRAVKAAKPRQTRDEFIAEVKAVVARMDAGTERIYSSKEVERELGL